MREMHESPHGLLSLQTLQHVVEQPPSELVLHPITSPSASDTTAITFSMNSTFIARRAHCQAVPRASPIQGERERFDLCPGRTDARNRRLVIHPFEAMDRPRPPRETLDTDAHRRLTKRTNAETPVKITDHQDSVTRLIADVRGIAEAHPHLIHTWRFAASALWAMRQYYTTRLDDSTHFDDSSYVIDTFNNLEALRDDKPLSPNWMRGFWFNAAIMRLDGLWERCFKVIVTNAADRRNGPTLYRKCCQALEIPGDYRQSPYCKVRRIVNQLKHVEHGASADNREHPDLPIELLNALLVVIRHSQFANGVSRLSTDHQ